MSEVVRVVVSPALYRGHSGNRAPVRTAGKTKGDNSEAAEEEEIHVFLLFIIFILHGPKEWI